MLILGQVIHAKKPEGDPLVNGLIMKAVQQCLVLHSPMGDIQHKGIEHIVIFLYHTLKNRSRHPGDFCFFYGDEGIGIYFIPGKIEELWKDVIILKVCAEYIIAIDGILFRLQAAIQYDAELFDRGTYWMNDICCLIGFITQVLSIGLMMQALIGKCRIHQSPSLLLYECLIQEITDIIVVSFSIETLYLFSVLADHYDRYALYVACVHDILILIHIDIADMEAVVKFFIQGFLKDRMKCFAVYAAFSAE